MHVLLPRLKPPKIHYLEKKFQALSRPMEEKDSASRVTKQRADQITQCPQLSGVTRGDRPTAETKRVPIEARASEHVPPP